MEIKAGRMVSLGYGKYWRSDAIVGLRPIEEDRGPGRRTEVYTATLEHPMIASRSEQAILQDMAVASAEQFHMEEAREVLSDLLGDLDDVPDVLRRVLASEGDFNVAAWVKRLRTFLGSEGTEAERDQPELFSP